MKKVFTLCLLSLALLTPLAARQPAPGTDIRIKINGIKDTTCILAFYYGDKQYIKDTLPVDATGMLKIQYEEPLGGGIYLLMLPDKSYFEFIISEQNFQLETTAGNLVMGMKCKNSAENAAFYQYLQYLEPKKGLLNKLQQAAPRVEAKGDADSVKLVKDLMAKQDEEVIAFKKKFMADHSTAFVTKVFGMSEPVVIPETLDSAGKFLYYKAHFFDKIDFSDDRLLRTPVFHQKLKEYFDNLVFKIADSAIVDVDRIVEMSRANKEMFKYVVFYLTNRYFSEKVICLDAVYVHLAKKVYLSGEAYWADSATIEKVRDRVAKMEPCLCGKIAQNVVMTDSLMKPIPLHSVKSKYTMLMFWDYDCGHCKKEMPLLVEKYDSLRAMGVEVYAVCTRVDPAPWKKFMREHKFRNWINVADLQNKTRFRDYYDIYSTPVIYILDEQKRIIAKRLDVLQVIGFIQNFEKAKKQKKP